MLIPQLSVYDINVKSAQEGFYFLVKQQNELIKEVNKIIEKSLEVNFDCTTGDLRLAPKYNKSDCQGNIDLEDLWGCEY